MTIQLNDYVLRRIMLPVLPLVTDLVSDPDWLGPAICLAHHFSDFTCINIAPQSHQSLQYPRYRVYPFKISRPRPPCVMASTEKREDMISIARDLSGVPMCDDYEKMISGMLCVTLLFDLQE